MFFDKQIAAQNKSALFLSHESLLQNIVTISILTKLKPLRAGKVLKVVLTWFISVIIKSPMGK